MNDKCQVLFLAANPQGTAQLALDEEIRSIEAKIRSADYRDSLELISKWAVRPDDLLQALNQHRPRVVHFSAHGNPTEELYLVGSDGQPKVVSKAALQQLFRVLRDDIRLVVFNACFSRPQAEAIVEHIDFAIGMNKAIGDEAASVFSSSFYRAIGFGRSVKDAFDQGVTALMLEGISEEKTPELLTREGVDASQVILVDAESFGADPVAAAPSKPNTGGRAAADIWREKLAFLQEQEAVSSDPAQKFALRKQIDEAQKKINELSN